MAKAWEELGPQLWAFFHNSVQINMIRVKPAEVFSLNANCKRSIPLQRRRLLPAVLHLYRNHPDNVTTSAFLSKLPSHLQDTLRNPTVRHFVDNSLEDSNLTTRDILNFLYTGPEEWREPSMPSFDWRNIFNVADQLLRTFNQYGEVRNITATLRRNRPISAFETFPGCRESLLGPSLGSSDRCISLPGLLPGGCNKAPF